MGYAPLVSHRFRGMFWGKLMKRRRRQRGRKGVILLLTAFLMVFFIGLIAFATDSGTIVLARTQLQSAADAAAIAGIDALSGGTTAAQTAAQTIAQANTAGGANISVVPSSDIAFGTWNSSTATFTVLTGSGISGASAMRVTCHLSQSRSTGLHLFFAPIFGISSEDVSATAIANKGSAPCGFVGLNGINISGGSYTNSYNSGSGYSAGSAGSQGNICSNSSISLSGGSTIVNGNATPGIGDTVSASGGSSVTGTTTAETTALSEPAVNTSGAAASNNNANIPLSQQGKNPIDGQGDFTLQGGDYLTLPAGTYYFAKLTLGGGSTITVNAAVVIYTTGDVDISGGSVANTTSIPSNFVLDSSTTGKVTISGSSQMYGIVYAPAADITRSGGSSDFFGSMVGKSLTLSGGGGLHYDTALGGGGSTTTQLVQ